MLGVWRRPKADVAQMLGTWCILPSRELVDVEGRILRLGCRDTIRMTTVGISISSTVCGLQWSHRYYSQPDLASSSGVRLPRMGSEAAQLPGTWNDELEVTSELGPKCNGKINIKSFLAAYICDWFRVICLTV